MRIKLKAFYSILILLMISSSCFAQKGNNKPRVIVTSDGEIDDECSLVRFLLYTNEWDVEGIISSSSQYHWHGHRWAGDDWAVPYLNAYEEVYPNLVLHDEDYPTPEYLKSITLLGNVADEGEMDSITPGSRHIVKVLLDETENQPIWILAWGGTNTIARALKTIEKEHPEKMDYVAGKLRLFFIWEQDSTYQAYIRPNWGKYDILTIISDQFWAIAYQWDKILPEDKIDYFKDDWMKSNILKDHGPLCSLYQAYKGGDDNEGWNAGSPKQKGAFRSEGDSPAFLQIIPTGLRNMESPGYGGWGGRYINVRNNTWLDPVPLSDYKYPEGRWYTGSAWGRNYMREEYPANQDLMREYFKPLTRWTDAIQNDFAARADWCVKSYDEANHPPVVKLNHPINLYSEPDSVIYLNANETFDPDDDELSFTWWYYKEASSFKGNIEIENNNRPNASFRLPKEMLAGETIHIICEVSDNGGPQLTRYSRVIVTLKPRILVSSDIGGTDPDDNQSMTHLLMYSNMFDIEGLVSSPSYGSGSKAEILRMIDLYEKDLPKLIKHQNDFPSPKYLRSITKQGHQEIAPYSGYSEPTKGSEWIISCAKRNDDRPLWVLVWGGLDDLAQALHDAPEIQNRIKVYLIGGPNKKWSTNSYAYIAENFPNLWFIEANASYRGFFSDSGASKNLISNYYNNHIKGRGFLGNDFKNYYEGNIKMGDTPSLLYLMKGDPNTPGDDHWGGSFEKINHSTRIVLNRNTSLQDTVPVYSIMEFNFHGPKLNIANDSVCFTMTIANQKWQGFYLGEGVYGIRYSPKQAENLDYTITSKIQELSGQQGKFVVKNVWPGKSRPTDYLLGDKWYSDRSETEWFDGTWQGAKTVLKWQDNALSDWAKRWSWIGEN